MRFLAPLLVLLLPLAAPLLRAASPASPNILYILADDLGWNGPGVYGNKDVATPHLDRPALFNANEFAYVD